MNKISHDPNVGQASSIIRCLRILGWEDKIILKDILSEIMPGSFVERRKQGFGAPLQDWFREEKTKNELDRIVKNEHHPIYNYLKKETVHDLF